MDAIILAGGRGTRLRDVICDIPKPLAPINGRPFLDILLQQLDKFACVKKVVLAVGYRPEMIIGRYKNCSDYRFKITFSAEKEPLGTGGAIKLALSLTDSRDVIVLNGDSFVEVDIDDLLRFHTTHHASISIVLKEMCDAKRYGSIKIDASKRIQSFQEKENTHADGFINAGMYVIRRDMLDDIKGGRAISFEKEILPEFINDAAYGYIVSGKFIDIGIPEAYRMAGEYLKEV